MKIVYILYVKSTVDWIVLAYWDLYYYLAQNNPNEPIFFMTYTFEFQSQ